MSTPSAIAIAPPPAEIAVPYSATYLLEERGLRSWLLTRDHKRIGIMFFVAISLALIAGMSRSAFASAFRHAFGQSPMSLVKVVRLRRASELLITTALPVGEVAKRVGFASRSNFSVAFSEYHGTDPSGFRRKFSVEAERQQLR